MDASGEFEVRLEPQPLSKDGETSALGRMSITKTFSGDLEATSAGEMLMVMTSVKGSAGYVAIERVTGTLHGRSGSFVLQHSGIMDRGSQHLDLSVVPDSGTGELAGLSGEMKIDIRDGKHFYRMQYVVDETRRPVP